MSTTARERLVEAAFELFESEGYDATTVDEIAARAGAGRSTFFRHFPGKEDVVMPAHDGILERMEARLSTASPSGRDVALREAAAVPLEHYLAEGETARARYRLARKVPAIRDREIASTQRYVRMFSQAIHRWLDAEPDGFLRAELVASGVVIAHNHVLRQWLRGELDDPAVVRKSLDRALTHALVPLVAAGRGTPTVVITGGAADVEDVVRQVRAALAPPTTTEESR